MPANDGKEQKKREDIKDFAVDSDEILKSSTDEELDFEDFTKTIDERIDLLFRPSEEVDETEIIEPLRQEEKEKETIETTTSVDIVDQKSSLHEKDETDLNLGLNLEILQKQRNDKTTDEDEKTSGVTKLLEKVHIAYLDLDWEFSKENVRKLQKALSALKSEMEISPGADKLFHVAKELLRLFLEDDSTVSYASMNLLRESLNMLLKIIQKPPKGDELESIDTIIKRFNRLVAQFEVKPLEEEPVKMDDVVADVRIHEGEEADKVERIADVQIQQETQTTSVSSLEAEEELELEKLEQMLDKDQTGVSENISEIISKVERTLSLLQQIRSAVDKENRLFSKIINIFSQRPKLKPVTEYLVRLQKNYIKYAAQLKTIEQDISESLKLLKTSPLPEKPQDVVEGVEHRAETYSVESTKVNDEVGQEIPESFQKLIIVQISGHNVGIPFKNVIRIASVTGKKMRSILGKGVAQLKDVKPFLKSIKFGVYGSWRDVPAKVLKSLKFPIIEIAKLGKEFQAPKEVVFYEGIVFLGDEEAYGALPVDAILSDRPEVLEKYTPGRSDNDIWVEGITETGKKLKILNVQKVLK